MDNVINEYQSYLNLTANENSMSLAAKKYLSSIAADRYYFEANNDGYSDFPEFVASGNEAFDSLLNDTRRDLGDMFEAGYVNLNPLSGMHAMLMVLLTLTEVGDVVASLSPQAHGHFSTQTVVGRIGRSSTFLPNTEGGDIDLGVLARFIEQCSPRMIYIDAMSYQHPFDIQAIRKVIGDKIIIVFDASHTLGLIAGDAFPNPLTGGADVVCGNTHKTFPGPHRGIILAKDKSVGEIIDKNGGNLYSTVQSETLMALAVTVAEMKLHIRDYASCIISNARALQSALVQKGVIPLNIPLTENHQVHILMSDRGAAVGFMKKLSEQGILTHVCYGVNEDFYIRLGTQEISRRGMGESEMIELADIINRILMGDYCKSEINELNKKFQEIKYSFDERSS